jgi:hypothetical protein
MLGDFAFWGFGAAMSVAVALILLLVFVFEIWMLVSAITNKRITDRAKVLWIVGMFLVHPIVAIVYYFTDYQKTR